MYNPAVQTKLLHQIVANFIYRFTK